MRNINSFSQLERDFVKALMQSYPDAYPAEYHLWQNNPGSAWGLRVIERREVDKLNKFTSLYKQLANARTELRSKNELIEQLNGRIEELSALVMNNNAIEQELPVDNVQDSNTTSGQEINLPTESQLLLGESQQN